MNDMSLGLGDLHLGSRARIESCKKTSKLFGKCARHECPWDVAETWNMWQGIRTCNADVCVVVVL